MSEDGIYPRVEEVTHSNICLYSRDFNHETSIKATRSKLCGSKCPVVALRRFVVWSSDQNWFIGILVPMGGSRLR